MDLFNFISEIKFLPVAEECQGESKQQKLLVNLLKWLKFE